MCSTFPREGFWDLLLGAYGVGQEGRAQQHLWSHQFVVVAAVWEDVGAEVRSVTNVLQMVARLEVMF